MGSRHLEGVLVFLVCSIIDVSRLGIRVGLGNIEKIQPWAGVTESRDVSASTDSERARCGEASSLQAFQEFGQQYRQQYKQVLFLPSQTYRMSRAQPGR